MVGHRLLQHLGELAVGVVALVPGGELVGRSADTRAALGQQLVDVADLLDVESPTAQRLRLRGLRGEGQGAVVRPPHVDPGLRDGGPFGAVRPAHLVQTTTGLVWRRARRHGRGE